MSSSTRRRTAWVATATLSAASLLAICGVSPAMAASAPATVVVPAAAPVKAAVADGEYAQRFLAQYKKIKDPANGYFSAQGIPYHSVETLIVEAPDYGHETTSEAYSYWLWLEALYGQFTEDWGPLNDAWATMEKYMIPTSADQPTNSFYNPNSPATYASEFNHPSSYPSQLNNGVTSGKDPIGAELKATYGNADVYGMHWLADVDNKYGFGATPGAGCELGPTATGTSYINTFQRGPQESVWETIPQPSCEEFKYGGPNGYLDLFTKDASYAKQWKYTNAPDADARAVEAVYWANQWATEQGKAADVAATVAKAAKMGDYLRYALFDKYFKAVGCTSPSCPAGSGKESAHGLLSWYYAWGGALDSSAGWAWRIGSSHAHFGYQNPLAAWVLSTDPALTPKSPTAKSDWASSMDRQLEFYKWLQAPQGGIAGGATNSWDGAYATPPAGTPTFYGMGYTEAPVYNDPPSNQWFGMQAWGVQRVAELYYASGNPQAKAILDKWVPWVVANISTDGASWKVPSELTWTGKPDTWNKTSPGANSGLSVSVKSYGQDVGVAGDTARALLFYAAKSGDTASRDKAKALLDAIWASNQDSLGVGTVETRGDFLRFDDTYVPGGNGVYVPAGWTGTMPNGDVVKPGVSFLDIRSWYKNDPSWPKIETALATGVAPQFTFHRFWAQTAIAGALGDYARLFEGGTTPDPDTTAPSVPAGLLAGTTTATSATISWTASTDNTGGSGVAGYDIYRGTTKVGSSTTPSFTETGLTPSTAYSYTVRAKDVAGNVSAASSALSVTTKAAPSDTTAPSVPTGLSASAVTQNSLTLSWSASTDNAGGSGLAGYDVYRGTTKVGSTTSTSYSDTGLTAATAYSYTVRAKDVAGNISAASSALSVTTLPATTLDTIAPSVPAGLVATTVTETSVALTWTASTDTGGSGLAGYDVYRGTTKVGTPTSASYTDSGLTAATAYQYTVRARDNAGNVSAASSALSVTTKSTTPTGSCKVSYTASSWNTGFTASVKVTNTGTTALSAWTLGFSFANGQTVTQGWSADWSQSGTAVTAKNAAWNGTLGAGQSTDIGFNGSHSGTNTNPTAFTLNGAACTIG
ncbi:glycoside hydrolase family 48 protein [Cellulomonas sp. Leaf395]|uniref:glycoside hydrolase family 48 protein n=1 Tax=Cellulomonas sp. Leaf395 TaxID=1736362 RepID=UPI000702127F|nr:glycoside hydrolase family 48 protein [Cellulomonas sp. Leaf395]KQS98804.1 exoglucanase [Cellulomonas sp. Leaf395]